MPLRLFIFTSYSSVWTFLWPYQPLSSQFTYHVLLQRTRASLNLKRAPKEAVWPSHCDASILGRTRGQQETFTHFSCWAWYTCFSYCNKKSIAALSHIRGEGSVVSVVLIGEWKQILFLFVCFASFLDLLFLHCLFFDLRFRIRNTQCTCDVFIPQFWITKVFHHWLWANFIDEESTKIWTWWWCWYGSNLNVSHPQWNSVTLH